MTLDKYTGPWNKKAASHFLRRTTYRFSKDYVAKVESMGMELAVSELLKNTPLPDPPINYYYPDDPDVPIGETWVNAPYHRISGFNTARNRSLAKWMIEQARLPEVSIKENMVLFWHNHFVTSDIGDPRFRYQYINTIRKNALGNFKQLTKEITIDPAMLRYLNGNQNHKNSPNENYARELLELFTVGKGKTVGEGDYTTFTEQDVREIARALTGWVIYGYNNVNRPDFGSTYNTNRHDRTDKQLSHRFNNAIISNLEGSEYAHVVDIIFQSDHCALNLARKLYLWFVGSDINENIEQNVIHPLAQICQDADFEVSPVLEALLSSSAFYDEQVIGCQIKHPLNFVLSVVDTFPMLMGENRRAQDDFDLGLFLATAALQMVIFQPPSVAGWKAFYQAPAFDKIWINSNSLPLRKILVDFMTTKSERLETSPEAKIDVIKVVDSTSEPLDINIMLQEITEGVFAYPLPESTVAQMKEILIPGLPDFEWTLEYGAYQNNPDDEDLERIIYTKLWNMFNYMMNLPEFQLI